MAQRRLTKPFNRDFDSYVCVGDTIRSTAYNGIYFVATVERDDVSETPVERGEGFFPKRADCKSESAFRRAYTRMESILAAWREDKWCYVGVCVAAHCARTDLPITGKYEHALWGVECNYPAPRGRNPNRYLRDVANELAAEMALEASDRLTEALRRGLKTMEGV